MGTMSLDAFARSLAYALTCHKRERAMRLVLVVIHKSATFKNILFQLLLSPMFTLLLIVILSL